MLRSGNKTSTEHTEKIETLQNVPDIKQITAQDMKATVEPADDKRADDKRADDKIQTTRQQHGSTRHTRCTHTQCTHTQIHTYMHINTDAAMR